MEADDNSWGIYKLISTLPIFFNCTENYKFFFYILPRYIQNPLEFPHHLK